MKVLYFHQHFSTPKYGGGIRSYEFAKKLKERGHEVTMVCGGNKSFGLPETKKAGVTRGVMDGIDVIQILVPYDNSFGKIKRMMSFLKFAWAGIKIAFSEKYDVLFATSTPLTAGIPGIIVKLFKKIKFVFEVRDLWPDLLIAVGLKNPLVVKPLRFLERQCYYKADACIGLSPGICEGINNRSKKGQRIELIPNGCDLNIFQPGNRENLKLDGIKPTDKVAVFTGAHGIANGLDAVLDAAKVLKDRGRNDIILVFIGNGNLKAGLMEGAKSEGLDNCRFYAPVPKYELSEIVCSSNIGLMTLKNIPEYYYGTSPNKFFDYIAAGIPVLNNYPGWLADMIKENKCGIVVEPDNPEAFADGLIYLADHSEECEKMGNNGRKLAETSFDRSALGNQFVDFLEDVCDKRNNH